MILDSLNNSAAYESLHPLFKQAFDYLKTADFLRAETGKTVLIENKLIVNIADICGKPKTDAAIETHNKYIDIQMPVIGVEKIGWKAGSELNEVSKPCDEENDITFYVDRPTAFTKIYPGQFAIYFPEDGHAPGIGEGAIKKVIVKVLVADLCK